jgi:hypothetical protein
MVLTSSRYDQIPENQFSVVPPSQHSIEIDRIVEDAARALIKSPYYKFKIKININPAKLNLISASMQLLLNII